MATTGQTINDRLNAVRYALVGQGLARTVCKATTEEVLGPKKKHIDYLIACTNEPNVSIPQIANLLIERTQHASWTVVFKSLISIHQLMSNGNERFTQYLATSNHSFELADFMDRTTPQGYNMSTFVRRYAKYINDKSISYRTLAIDLCKIRSGNDNALRTVNMDKLSKMLPIVQAQFDSLLEFGATTKDLNNGIIMSAFRLLYKDLVKLYVAYQEAIINLLERYFKLSRKKAREALEMYKKYLARMDKVAEFLSIVDSVELDKSEMPDLTKSPASILALLEQHLAQLEAKKRGTTPVSPEAEEEGENKENEAGEEKETSEPKNIGDRGDQKRDDQSSDKNLSKEAGASTSSSKEPEKQQPPQKPARPSPKASPVVSPPSSKPAPSSTAVPPHPPPPAHHSHQQQVATEQKKAVPPERPAKPPSRPPPPSSAVQAPVAPSTPNVDPDQASKSEDQQPKVSSEAATNPHQQNPPPPPHPPAPSSSSASPTSPKQDASTTNTNGNASVETNATLCSVNTSNMVGSSNATSTTDGTTNHHTESNTNNETEQSEPNHVNNMSQVETQQAPEELIMPPPPPPIDDLEEQEVGEVLPADGLQEPVVNGQSEGPSNGGVE